MDRFEGRRHLMCPRVNEMSKWDLVVLWVLDLGFRRGRGRREGEEGGKD